MIEARITIEASPALIAAIERLADALGGRRALSDDQIQRLKSEWEAFDKPSAAGRVTLVSGHDAQQFDVQQNTGVGAASGDVRPLGDGGQSAEQDDTGVASTQRQSSLPQTADQPPVSADPPPTVQASVSFERSGMPWMPWEDELIRKTPGSLHQIAEKCQRTVQSISARRSKLNAALRAPAPAAAPVVRVVPVAEVEVRPAPASPPQITRSPVTVSVPVIAKTASPSAPVGRPVQQVLQAAQGPKVCPKFANKPAANGKIYASFGEVKAWAAHFRIHFDGGNVDAVNSLRKQFKLPELVVKS